jgi:predicted Zn-ribbon and HTH transcriptional regulator
MPEVQDILSKHMGSYLERHSLSSHKLKTVNALIKCRTSSLGGHATICEDCGHMQISYNSCRNRHCPKCQTLSKEQWIDIQKYQLLNIGYFHVVMTVPDTLHNVILQNQSSCYSILFKAVSETLKELAMDKKYLGAQIGITSILHTWGQNLMFHPHIHCIVHGGGLNSIRRWIIQICSSHLPPSTKLLAQWFSSFKFNLFYHIIYDIVYLSKNVTEFCKGLQSRTVI